MKAKRYSEGCCHLSHTWMYSIQLSQESQTLNKANTPSLSACEMSAHFSLSWIDSLCLEWVGFAFLVWIKTSGSPAPAYVANQVCLGVDVLGYVKVSIGITDFILGLPSLPTRVNGNCVKLGIALSMTEENSRNPQLCLSEKTFFCVVQVSPVYK